MDILYYSNYCKHSQNIIQTLVKSNLTDKISFVCIDKRSRDPSNGQTYITLENGGKVIMPPNVHSVPSLLIIKEQYRVLMGDDIIKHLHPQIKNTMSANMQSNIEPSGYFLTASNGGTNIMSEKFTSYDMTPDELSAKGNGKARPLYNYISVQDDMNLINTPPDDYKPDKISNDVTLDTLQQKRMDDIGQSNQHMPPNIQPRTI
jgi:hypothetical protein